MGVGAGLYMCDVVKKSSRSLSHLLMCSCYIMKLCSRLFVLYCRSRPKDDKYRHLDPHFEEVRGGVEPWWMARWKARAEFLLSAIELLFLSLTVEALQGKTCQNSLPSGVGRSLGAKISTWVCSLMKTCRQWPRRKPTEWPTVCASINQEDVATKRPHMRTHCVQSPTASVDESQVADKILS